MEAAAIKHVWILGPPGAGKSSLTVAVRQSVERFQFGFWSDTNFKITLLGEAKGDDFDKKLEAPIISGERDFLDYNYQGLSNSTFENMKVIFNIKKIKEYLLISESYNINITDVKGEDGLLLLSDDKYLETDMKNRRDKLISDIEDSSCLIWAVPAHIYDDGEWGRSIGSLLDKLRRQAEGKLERVVVAWTHADLYFARYGRSAIDFMADGDAAQYLIEAGLSHFRTTRERLDACATGHDGLRRVEVLHVLCSAFGTFPDSGGVNGWLNEHPERYFDGTPGIRPDQLRVAWRPSAADPLLLGVFGASDHVTAIDHLELFRPKAEQTPESPDIDPYEQPMPPPDGPVEPSRTIWRTLFRFLRP